jgi:hypothetical protein
MRKTVAALAALLALGACSNGGDAATDQKEPKATPQTQQSVEPVKAKPVTTIKCDDLKTAKTIPEGVDKGCAVGSIDNPEEIVSPGIFDCADGSKLLGDSTPEFGDLWGYVGKEAHHESPDSSPEYAKAYEKCGA